MKTRPEAKRPDWQPSEDEYQGMAAGAHAAAYRLLRTMHSINAANHPGMTDAGPLINGMLAAICQFGLEGTATPAGLRRMINHALDAAMPQIAMSLRSGPHPGGHA